MAVQSTLALLGVRTATLGSSSTLANAFALSEGSQDPAAHTSASRIGTYADRTASAEKIGVVVMGTEVLSIGVGALTSAVQVVTPACTTSKASLNIPAGTAPTSPNSGDIWQTTSGFFFRISSTTQQLLTGNNTVGAASGGMAIWTGTNNLAVADGINYVFDTSFSVTGLRSLQVSTLSGAASGASYIAKFTSGSVTGMAASTEAPNIIFDFSSARQFATGAITTQREIQVLAPQYTAVAASTITTAATLAISDAPSAGTNVTITNAYALWVQAGVTQLAGAVGIGGQLTASSLVLTAASTTGSAGLRLPHGSAPTSPTNGDVWTTTSGMFARINGATIGPFPPGASVTLYTPGTYTWTKPAGCSVVIVSLIAGGGGGGSGRYGSTGTASSGGGGGSPGGWAQNQVFSASMISSSVTVVCGAKGTGGAAQTTPSTNGNNGNNGTASTFGSTTDAFYVYAVGGNFGSGGGTASGLSGTGVTPSMTPMVGNNYSTSQNGLGGTQGGTSATSTPSSSPLIGGGAGGAGTGCTAANAAATAGSVGGGASLLFFAYWNANLPAGGTAGNSGTGGNGANGQSVLNAYQICHGQGGAGGAGGLAGGGAGGNGGNYGAAGGGGGGSQTGSSGKGGDGADGVVLIIAY